MMPAVGSNGGGSTRGVEAPSSVDDEGSADLLDRAVAVGIAPVDELRHLGLDVVETARCGATIADAEGREYLDCIAGAGMFDLGRGPTEMLDALDEAVRTVDQGTYPLVSAEKAEFSRRLSYFVAAGLDRVVLSVARGEAFDVACKLARAHTRRGGLASVDGGWHGETGFALSLSAHADRDDAMPLIPGTRSVPLNDFAAAREVLDDLVAAFVLEPVQAENGCRVVDAEWARTVADLCRERGIVFVVDETQTGMGRTGARFAFTRWGVTPDVLVLGESVTAGVYPLCATLLSQDIGVFLDDHPLVHLSTFGGSDVGCLVGLRALDAYSRARPWRNAAAMGSRLREGLEAVIADHPETIAGVDGLGALLALDLVDADKAAAFCGALRGEGVLALPGAVARHTVVVRPSLLVSEAEVDRLVAACRASAVALEGRATDRAPSSEDRSGKVER